MLWLFRRQSKPRTELTVISDGTTSLRFHVNCSGSVKQLFGPAIKRSTHSQLFMLPLIIPCHYGAGHTISLYLGFYSFLLSVCAHTIAPTHTLKHNIKVYGYYYCRRHFLLLSLSGQGKHIISEVKAISHCFWHIMRSQSGSWQGPRM